MERTSLRRPPRLGRRCALRCLKRADDSLFREEKGKEAAWREKMSSFVDELCPSSTARSFLLPLLRSYVSKSLYFAFIISSIESQFEKEKKTRGPRPLTESTCATCWHCNRPIRVYLKANFAPKKSSSFRMHKRTNSFHQEFNDFHSSSSSFLIAVDSRGLFNGRR